MDLGARDQASRDSILVVLSEMLGLELPDVRVGFKEYRRENSQTLSVN